MNASTVDMTRTEWLEERRKGLGGSDAGAVLGLNKWKSPVELYLEKTGQRPEEPETAKMRAGRAMEEVIAQLFAEETGLQVRQDHKLRVHADFEFIRANLDRVIVGDSRGPGILECKNVGGQTLRDAEADGYAVPPSHYCQWQHYSLVTGYTWGYLAYFVDGWDLRLVHMERNEAFVQDTLLPALCQFWLDHVQAGVPPAAESSKDVLALFPRSTPGRSVEITDEALVEQLRRLKEVKALIKPLEDEESALTEEVKKLMGDAESLTIGGQNAVTWKSTKDVSRFDEKRFAAENAELAAKYTVTVPGSRRFLVK